MADFFERYPDGSFDSECSFSQVDGRWVAIVKAYAYRDREDPHPGVGLAAEYIPGKTPYTRDSELENAQTSAIGRAILSVGASKAKKPIASREEVRNRTADSTDNVTDFPDNAAGREALRKLCEEKSWDPVAVAKEFQVRFNKAPRKASNDDLTSFVNSIRGGVITLFEPEPEPQPA
jgi:hypothetical protein